MIGIVGYIPEHAGRRLLAVDILTAKERIRCFLEGIRSFSLSFLILTESARILTEVHNDIRLVLPKLNLELQ